MPDNIDNSLNETGAVIHRQFSDLATYSSTDKTAISVRDGVLEYLGIELGMEPQDKVFSVYRSPATIANVHPLMTGIPLTNEHVSLDIAPPDTGSSVKSATMIDMIDEHTSARVAIKNQLSLDDSAILMLDEKKQLSLGYNADLVPHSLYDFEQINIVPHHLAAVPAGRCGPLCSFLDRKPTQPMEPDMAKKLNKAFLDAEGSVSLEQVVEMATALPEAIRKIPVEKLSEVVPALQEMVSYASEQGAMPEAKEAEATDEAEEIEAVDAETEEKEEEKPAFSDKHFKDAVSEAVKKETAIYANAVNKARSFLDETYDFSDKTAAKIMRDALATQSTDNFEDSELSVAFKLLRKNESDYTKFGDQSIEGGLTARIKQELEG